MVDHTSPDFVWIKPPNIHPKWDKHPWWPFRYDFAVKTLASAVDNRPWRRKRNNGIVQYYKVASDSPSSDKIFFVAFHYYDPRRCCKFWITRGELIAAFHSLLKCWEWGNEKVLELADYVLDPITRFTMQETPIWQEANDMINLWHSEKSPGQNIYTTAYGYGRYLDCLSDWERHGYVPTFWHPHNPPITLLTFWNSTEVFHDVRVNGHMSAFGLAAALVINQYSSTGAFPVPEPMKAFHKQVIDMMKRFNHARASTPMVRPPDPPPQWLFHSFYDDPEPPPKQAKQKQKHTTANANRNLLRPREARKGLFHSLIHRPSKVPQYVPLST